MSKVVKSTFILMMATLCSKVFGFLRDLVLASSYGAGAVSDAYLMALNIISISFMSIVCVAIQTTFTPLFTNTDKTKGRNEAIGFTNNLINIILILSSIVIVLGLVFTEPLVKVFAMGFEGERLALTVEFTKIILFAIGIVCVTYIIKGYLEIHDNFLVTGLMPLPYNIIIVFTIILSKSMGLNVLAYGTLLAFIAQFVLLLPFAYKKGYKYQPKLNLKDENIKQMALLIVPVLVGASVTQVNSMIDKNLASTLAEGALSALNYGYKLNIFVTGMFVASITSVIYPLFARLTSENNLAKLKETISTSINAVMLLIVPISVGAFILATPIIQILFERGEFNSEATVLTGQVLACYAVGMLASGVRDILVRAYYSLQDTKTPMKNSVLCVCFNVIFNLLLIKHLKAPGLALASSLSAILAVAFLLFNLRKKIGSLNGKIMLETLIKTSISAFVMAIAVLPTYNMLQAYSQILGLIVSVAIGAIVYGIMVIVLKVKSCDYVLDIVKRKLNKKK